VAVGRTETGNLALTLIDLSSGAPTALPQKLTAPWASSLSARPCTALCPRGECIAFTDGEAGQLAVYFEGSTTAVTHDLPPGESGPVAIAVLPGEGRFLMLNAASRNLSVIDVKVSDAAVTFQPAVDLSASESGDPVDLVTSHSGEVFVLMERGVLLVHPESSEVVPLTFRDLFSDETSGQIGSAVATQP
jgi:hypothetical protein